MERVETFFLCLWLNPYFLRLFAIIADLARLLRQDRRLLLKRFFKELLLLNFLLFFLLLSHRLLILGGLELLRVNLYLLYLLYFLFFLIELRYDLAGNHSLILIIFQRSIRFNGTIFHFTYIIFRYYLFFLLLLKDFL